MCKIFVFVSEIWPDPPPDHPSAGPSLPFGPHPFGAPPSTDTLASSEGLNRPEGLERFGPNRSLPSKGGASKGEARRVGAPPSRGITLKLANVGLTKSGHDQCNFVIC